MKILKNTKYVNSEFLFIIFGLALTFLLAVLYTRIPLKHYLIFVGGIIFIILTFYRIEWSIGLLIASMLYERGFIPGIISVSLTRFLSLPVLLACVIKILIKHKKFHFQKIKDTIILVLFIWMIPSLFYAKNISQVQISLFTYLQLIFTYFILKTIIENERVLNKVLETMLIAGAGIAIFVIISIINNPDALIYTDYLNSSERVTGSSDDPNKFAMGLVFILPFGIYLFLTKNKLFFIPVALFSFLILSTFSRGGILGFTVVIILSLVQIIKLRKNSIIYSFLFLLILLGSFRLFNKGNKFIKRIESVQKLENANTRLDMIVTALDMGAKNPVLGVGFKNFEENSHLYGTKNHYRRSSHNGYLEIFATLGLPGFLLLMGLIYSAFKNIKNYQNDNIIKSKNMNRHNYLLMANFIKISFIGYLVAACFLGLISQKFFWVLLVFSSILQKCHENYQEG